MQVTGDIVIKAECSSFAGATGYVYLEDVGRADASAQRIGVSRLEQLAHVRGTEGRIPFVVAGSATPATQDVIVRVHLSLDGREEIVSGDLVSTTHIPAVTDRSVEVAVREI